MSAEDNPLPSGAEPSSEGGLVADKLLAQLLSDAGVMQEAQRVLQQRVAEQLLGQSVEQAGPYETRGTADMYRKEREVAYEKAKPDPRLFFAARFAWIMGSGQSAYPEMIELRAVEGLPRLFHPDEKHALAAMSLFEAASKAMQAGTYDGLPDRVGYVDTKHIVGWSRFRLPLVVEDVLKKEKTTHTLGFIQVVDMIENDAGLRERLYSNNSDVRDEAGDELVDKVLKSMGISVERLKEKPNSYRFHLPRVSTNVRRLIDAKAKEISTEELLPFNPRFDPGFSVDPESGWYRVVDYKHAGGAIGHEDVLAGLEFLVKGAEMILDPFGRFAQYDPSFLGKYYYHARSALRRENYVVNFGMGNVEARPYVTGRYADFWSENAHKLVPIMIKMREKGFIDAGLETKSPQERERIVFQRQQIIDFMVMDRPVRPWLEPYLDVIAKRGVVEVGPQVIMHGFNKRDGWQVDRNSMDKRRRHGKGYNAIVASKTRVNFNEDATALRFLLYNRCVRGWLRTKDQMRAVASGLVKNPLAIEAFKDMPDVKWREVLEEMGVDNARIGVLLDQASQTQQGQTSSSGVNGLKVIAEEHSFEQMKYAQNLAAFDPWKWYYYLSSAKSGGDKHFIATKSVSVAGFTEFETPRTALQNPYRSIDEQLAIGKAFAEESAMWAYGDSLLLAEKAEELLVLLFSLGVDHKNNTYRRFHVKNDKRTSSFSEDLTKANDEAKVARGEGWSGIPLETDYSRPELGFFVVRRQTDVEGSNVNESLVGPGGSQVLKAYDVGKSFPSRAQFGGRPINIGVVELIAKALGDAELAPEENISQTLHFLIAAHDKDLEQDVVLSDVEKKAETIYETRDIFR